MLVLDVSCHGDCEAQVLCLQAEPTGRLFPHIQPTPHMVILESSDSDSEQI